MNKGFEYLPEKLRIELNFTENGFLKAGEYQKLGALDADFVIILGVSSQFFGLNLEAFKSINILEPDLSGLKSFINKTPIYLFSKINFITSDGELKSLLSKINHEKILIFYLLDYSEIALKLNSLITNERISTRFILNSSEKILKNYVSNLKLMIHSSEYLKVTSKTALIIGAGPSLAKSVEEIKNIRTQVEIFASLRITNFLISNGIIPDYVAILDPHEMIEDLNDQIYEIPCLASLQANHDQIKRFKKINPISHQTLIPILEFLQNYLGLLQDVDAGHTVVSFMVSMTIKLGFKQLILYGVDLCYEQNRKYCFRSDDKSPDLVSYMKQDGTKILTQNDFILSKYWLENKVLENSDGVFVNRSDGLEIDGFSTDIVKGLLDRCEYNYQRLEPSFNYQDDLEKLGTNLMRMINQDVNHPLCDVLLYSDLQDLGLLIHLENLFSLFQNLGIIRETKKLEFFLSYLKNLQEKIVS